MNSPASLQSASAAAGLAAAASRPIGVLTTPQQHLGVWPTLAGQPHLRNTPLALAARNCHRDTSMLPMHNPQVQWATGRGTPFDSHPAKFADNCQHVHLTWQRPRSPAGVLEGTLPGCSNAVPCAVHVPMMSPGPTTASSTCCSDTLARAVCRPCLGAASMAAAAAELSSDLLWEAAPHPWPSPAAASSGAAAAAAAVLMGAAAAPFTLPTICNSIAWQPENALETVSGDRLLAC